MLEFYCAYMNVNGMMDFCEKLIQKSVMKATGGLVVEYEGKKINFSKFERIAMRDAIIRHFPERWKLQDQDIPQDLSDPLRLSKFTQYVRRVFIAETDGSLSQHSQSYPLAKQRIWEGVDKLMQTEHESGGEIEQLFDIVVEPNLIQPTFIIDYPKSISPLSKASPEDPQIAERFELFINGMEVANGFSELNDPREQYERFVDQAEARERGDDEAMVLDEDYVRALSYGMPPAAGIGIGIDRLVMLLTNKHSIRDVILFPHMRPERKQEAESTEDDE
ncbi:MAG: hypothetical protein DCC44_07960 [Acidobacteria bacterium]|nr:MAG: hypothetical protein DCC44_07960 [Acidobacteriota bacterium]